MVTAQELEMSVVSPEVLARLEEARAKVEGKVDFWGRLTAFFDDSDPLELLVCEDLLDKLHEGDQVLVVKHKVISLGQVHAPYAGTMVELELGVLNSNPVVEENKEIRSLILPTNKYVKRDDRLRPYGSERWEVHEGPIRKKLFDLSFSLGNDLKKKVDDFFCPTSDGGGSYRRFFGEKGLFIYKNEEIEQFFRKNEGNVRIYVQGLDLLGCEIRPEIRKDYNSTISETAVKLVSELEKLLIKESMVTGRISAIYSASECGGMVEGGAVLLVDGEGDAFFASYGLRENLRDIRGKIAGCLREAVDVGLHETSLKLKGRPGVTLDVSEYVGGLCKEYRVGIPT